MNSFSRVLPAIILVWAGAGCATMTTPSPPKPTLSTVSFVDLDRYLGRWYVIAYTPNFLENGKVATADNYARRADGKLDANYSFRRGSFDAPEQEWKGVATIVNSQTNAEWKVQFLWPFSADYRVLELDPDYRWSVVASRSGKWVWILARETSLPSAVYTDLQQRIATRGLDVQKMKKVPQVPIQR